MPNSPGSPGAGPYATLLAFRLVKAKEQAIESAPEPSMFPWTGLSSMGGVSAPPVDSIVANDDVGGDPVGRALVAD